MKLGIMQPYFIPYIGYWQLLNAVDQYVVYDDVNFMKGGWINRNRILTQGNPQYINIQMQGASSFKFINEVQVNTSDIWRKKLLNTIRMSYGKAPEYEQVFPVLEDIINCKEENLAKFLMQSIKKICAYLDITTQIYLSSEMEQDRALSGQARIIDICKRLKATVYYNAIGGKELYSREEFLKHEIKLYFLNTQTISYPQFQEEFEANLSILDVLMFNSKSDVQIMLNQFTLL